jgi:hypothetical protein
MHDIHHGHVETDVIHLFGQMIGDLLLLKSGTGDPKQRLFDFQHARGFDVLLHVGRFDGHGFLSMSAAAVLATAIMHLVR